MEFKAENFNDAVEELKTLFQLGNYFDITKDPYPVIAFYQAIGVRKIELTMQELLTEMKTLNSKLNGIKNQMGLTTTNIIEAIDRLPQAHDPV